MVANLLMCVLSSMGSAYLCCWVSEKKFLLFERQYLRRLIFTNIAPLSFLDIRARVARGAHPHILLRDVPCLLSSQASPRVFHHSPSQRD